MSKQPPVMVFGGHAADEISQRLMLLGFRALRAGDVAEARDQLEAAGDEVRAALIDATTAPDDIRSLRGLAPKADLLAIGPRPAEPAIQALRKAGVRIGVFDPVDDGVLQFWLGQATNGEDAAQGRRYVRVPTRMTAIVHAKTGMRTAGVHEMSEGGAFLATLRPLMEGAVVPVELRFPERTVRVEATVVWSNVIGNLRRQRHPTGMAVEFGPLPQEDMDLIAEFLRLQVETFHL